MTTNASETLAKDNGKSGLIIEIARDKNISVREVLRRALQSHALLARYQAQREPRVDQVVLKQDYVVMSNPSQNLSYS